MRFEQLNGDLWVEMTTLLEEVELPSKYVDEFRTYMLVAGTLRSNWRNGFYTLEVHVGFNRENIEPEDCVATVTQATYNNIVLYTEEDPNLFYVDKEDFYYVIAETMCKNVGVRGIKAMYEQIKERDLVYFREYQSYRTYRINFSTFYSGNHVIEFGGDSKKKRRKPKKKKEFTYSSSSEKEFPELFLDYLFDNKDR